ncbi:MAG TPA: site-specific integrase [Mucilaginibacter sp.]|jgi:integrase|nr:site-specific integrase [Mucilaginibacter sp.]
MASIAVVLNTTKKLSNDEYTVSLRITHDRQSQYFAFSNLLVNHTIKWRCRKEDWKPAETEDNGLGKFRRSFGPYKECNAILEAKLQEAQAILQRYDTEGLAFSFEQFEADLKRKEAPLITSLQEYYNAQIAILDEQGRVGLSGLYLENKRILDKFRPDALLSDINIRFLESFEYWMRNERGNKDTTISVKMRNLQRVINQAIEDKLFKQTDYPFGEKRYSINKRLDSKTKKIAVTLDKIDKLKALELQPGSWLHTAQQMFLFSYYSRGMNFVDMTYLKWSQITEEHISYVRKKTRGSFEIPINKYNGTILRYFKDNYRLEGNFVFPILNPTIHKTLKQQYTRKKTALDAVNHALKKLVEMIGEPNLRLTTNVGRHTYATGLKRSGANTSYITEALGHATQEQTEIYLAEFEKGVIESWENKMFGQ